MHSVSSDFPVNDRLRAVHIGPGPLGGLHVGYDTPLGQQEPAVGLVDRRDLLWEPIAGKPFVDLRGSQYFIRNAVQVARLLGVQEERAVGCSSPNRARGNHQLFSGGLLHLVPKLVGPAHQRHVGRVLLEGVTNHPGIAVGRPHLVGYGVLFQAQDFQSPPG